MRYAACAFLVRKGKVLLLRRSTTRAFYPGAWDAAGGHLEPGETPHDALARELEEELGVRPSALTEVAILDEPDVRAYGPAKYHIFVVFEWEGEPRLLGDEHTELRWCTLDQALTLELAHPRYAHLLSEVLRGPVRQLRKDLTRRAQGVELGASLVPTDLLVIYDGECRFCRWGIAWIARLDLRHRLRFCPFSHPTAQRALSHIAPGRRYESMHVLADGRLSSGTAAAERILRELPLGRLASALRLHCAYPVIARYRGVLGRLSPERPPLSNCGHEQELELQDVTGA